MFRLALTAALLPGLAFAQEVPPADEHQLAEYLLQAITTKNWGLLVAVALVLAVALVRRFGRSLPVIGPWLDHPVVAWLLPTLLAIGSTVVAALVDGAPISLTLVASAIITGLTANGLFNGAKKLQEASAGAGGAPTLLLLLVLASSSGCAHTPTQAAAVAGQTLAEVGATYRRTNLAFIDGCTAHRIPMPTCGAWARFSAEFVTAYNPIAEAYLAGTDPAGPRWAELVASLGAFAAQLATLAAGGTP